MKKILIITGIVFAILTFCVFFLSSKEAEQPQLGKLNLEMENRKGSTVGAAEERVPSAEKPKPKMPLKIEDAKSFYIGGVVSAEYSFDEDMQGGVLKAYYESGDLLFEARLKEGQLNGLFKSYYPSGANWEKSNYKNGQLEGSSELFYESGTLLAEFYYRQSILAFIPKFYSEDTSMSSRMKLESKDQKGYFKAYDDKGQLINEWNFQGGEGGSTLHKTTFKSGSISAEWGFEEKTLNGLIKIYYENGAERFETKYREGAVLKAVKKKYPEGELCTEESYSEEGLKKLTRFYYPSGFQWFTIDHNSEVKGFYPKLQSELKVTVTVVK